jgi:hypothetical protein
MPIEKSTKIGFEGCLGTKDSHVPIREAVLNIFRLAFAIGEFRLPVVSHRKLDNRLPKLISIARPSRGVVFRFSLVRISALSKSLAEDSVSRFSRQAFGC